MKQSLFSTPRRFTEAVILTLALLFFMGACAGEPVVPETPRDMRAKHVENYTFDRGTDLAERVTAAPDFVLEYWSVEDGRQYTDYTLSADEARTVRQCLDILPARYKAILKDRLLGIYFIKDFLGSGLTDYVLDENGAVYTILLFNPSVLGLNLSELVTRKENTCFIPDRPDISVSVTLDDSIPGLLYILMHEATHCIDYINHFTPFVEPDMPTIPGAGPAERKRPFCDRLWAGYNRFNDNFDFAYKDRVTFYGMKGGPKINISEAPAVYRAMEKIPVVSLYSTFNWAEDFAEYMTFFYLTQLMGTDYAITVSENGEILNQYRPFENKRVLARIDDLAEMLE